MYIVINIGCIECGVSSNVVGVFAEEAKAQAVADFCDQKYAWRQDGQNSFEVFPLPAPGDIDEEYDLSGMKEARND